MPQPIYTQPTPVTTQQQQQPLPQHPQQPPQQQGQQPPQHPQNSYHIDPQSQYAQGPPAVTQIQQPQQPPAPHAYMSPQHQQAPPPQGYQPDQIFMHRTDRRPSSTRRATCPHSSSSNNTHHHTISLVSCISRWPPCPWLADRQLGRPAITCRTMLSRTTFLSTSSSGKTAALKQRPSLGSL